MIKNQIKHFSFGSAILTMLLLELSCVTNSETKRQQLIVVSDSQMNAMGESTYSEAKKNGNISRNNGLTAVVKEIGERLAKASGKNYAWDFTLFDSKEINAWCLPGGKVGVYTGILPVAESNAGLAAVLGHEIAHAILRHGAERVSHSLLVSGVMLTLDQALKDHRRKPYILAAFGLGAQFGMVLPYSRKQESEADFVGIDYMAKAGFNPEEAVTLWRRMAKLGGSRLPEFLSTHPDPIHRASDLQSELTKVKSIYEASAKVTTKELPL